MSNTGKEMACICELYINGKQGVAITPLELRQILLKAGYESQIREYHEVLDLSRIVITLVDSGLTEEEIKDFFDIYLKACSEKRVRGSEKENLIYIAFDREGFVKGVFKKKEDAEAISETVESYELKRIY